MGKLRENKCYKRLERPYTRKSKYKKKMYIRGGVPPLRITKFDMGVMNREFPLRVSMFSLQTGQILNNCMEAARQAAHKYITKVFGKEDFHFKIKPYPHHVVRIHPIAMGAGADRYSSGMAKAYGKPTNLASQVRAGQEIMYIEAGINREKELREALRKASSKLGLRVYVELTKKEMPQKISA